MYPYFITCRCYYFIVEIRKDKEEFHQWKKTLQCHTLFFDGASKGNLGEAGVGGIIFDPGGNPVVSFPWGIGRKNQQRSRMACSLSWN